MHTTKVLQSFSAGELSPLMDSRFDQEKYNSGCRTMENFLPLIYGGAEFRPGTYYVGTAKDSAVKIRLVSFIRSTSTAFVLEFGVNYIRFYKDEGRFVGSLLASTDAWADATDYIMGDFVSYTNVIYRCLASHTSATGGGDGAGGEPDTNTTQWIAASLTTDLYPIYELVTPYLEADLYELKFYQSVDVMWITHPDYEPRKLSRLSSTDWSIEEVSYADGPFRDQNTDTTITITPTATTGNITLTASSALFVDGTTAGHEPSGSLATSKSVTGALFKIIHAMDGINISNAFSAAGAYATTLAVPKGVKWYFVTGGLWTGTMEVERSYDSGVTYESVFVCNSEQNKNFETSMTESLDDAIYRMNATTLSAGTCNAQLFTTDYNHEGIVEITAVASTTSATATVLKTLGDTQATHRWAEGYWSNRYGWPSCVTISPEERLTFAGSTEYPLTLWGSGIGNYSSMEIGDEDDDAVIFTLCADQQNQIHWIITRDVMIVGTDGGEHKISSTNENQPITPTNIQAKPQSFYGSANIQALIVNDATIYVQRGGRKIREMTNVFTVDGDLNYKSDDLTVFSNHITESGLTCMAYQRVPDPALICVRTDGQIAYMAYEKEQNIFSWCRLVTETAAGESDFESVCVIPTESEEDQIWCSVERVINGATVRFIEYFSARDF